VSLVGFGLGSRPSAFFDASRLLRQAQIPAIKSFTTRESLCFVIPASRVDEAVTLMHETFIERANPEALFGATGAHYASKGVVA
jgi:aspartokinase